MKPKNNMRPIHPGEILREEYLLPMDLSANRLAASIDVPTNRLTEIIGERRGITADTALRLAKVFSTTPQFWMNLQQAYDLRRAEMESGKSLEGIEAIGEAKRKT